MLNHVLTALFQKFQILSLVFIRKGLAGYNLGSATMHLECPDGAGQDGYVGFQTADPAFNVPEFLETDIRRKPTLSNMVVKQLQPYPVGNDG